VFWFCARLKTNKDPLYGLLLILGARRASGVIKMISQNVHLGFLIHILISEAPSAPREWRARGVAAKVREKTHHAMIESPSAHLIAKGLDESLD
jgi:hypothetical protein